MSIRIDERTSGTLVEAVKDLQDCTSWNQFVVVYGPMFRNWLGRYGLSHDEKEDVVSEVFCKLVINLPKFVYNPQMRFRGWLHRIVDNAARDTLRRNSRIEKLHQKLASEDSSNGLESPCLTEETSLEHISESFEKRLRFAQAVVRDVRSRAAATTWESFYLKEVEEWTGPTVAQHLGISIEHVYVNVFRIRKMLEASRGKLASQFPQV